MISPPAEFSTGEFTVSGLAVLTTMLPPVATVRPAVPLTVPMINEPVFVMKMPPVSVVAATMMPVVDVVIGATGVPMPVAALS